MPGTRTFQVEVDGHRVNKTFGTHGQEGFRWTEAGTFELDEEVVELSLVDRTMSLQTGKQIGQRMKFLLGISGPDIYAFEVNYRLFLKLGTLCGF
ncbi:hypothetical protein [Paenibacillus sp. PAMC21692]|uniref:hypothetical protein n=1 Tax=Paenibacillus sp. PAMC21692 TaxID=2762320 RepID=UPI00164E8DF6|nr:hypothetical protein [Paenibacillus sp. PAMC21692]QNK56646.1 hypothetical protein H7F31_29630 [Paenibacillus sp. PAMC21692]